MNEYRGVIHIHTSYCDGDIRLEPLRESLKKQGFSFAIPTAHVEILTNREQYVKECRRLSDNSFLFIPGYERQMPFLLMVHILTLGENESVRILAHPETIEGPISPNVLAQIDGIEVWNLRYDKDRPSKKNIRLLQNLKKQNYPLFAIAGGDLHHEQKVPFSVVIKLEKLTEDEILRKIKRQEFNIVSPNIVISPSGEIFNKRDKRE